MDGYSIARTDVGSPTRELESPDPVLETYYRQQLKQLYADPFQRPASNDGIELSHLDQVTIEQAHGQGEEEYDFRLFAKPSASGPTSAAGSYIPQRIALRSPSPVGGESGFTVAARPDKYYFAGRTEAHLAEQYVQAAVSGQDINEGLKMRWRGMELPWRVTVVKSTNLSKPMRLERQLLAQTNRRKRSGKKRRMVIRKRFEQTAAKELAVRQIQAENEVAEREKRTRKNREKKVKKRQKDKLKKANDLQDLTGCLH